MPTAEDMIRHFKLEALPTEGGLFIQSWRAPEIIRAEQLPERYLHDKPFGVAIYYLLTADPDSFSALHKLPTDEIFHFYLGDPVLMLNLYPDGGSQRVILGHDILNGQQVQHVVPYAVWQGCHLQAGGAWALMGTTMAPGFTNDDYVGAEREVLIAAYPGEAELITRLTRTDQPLQRPHEQE